MREWARHADVADEDEEAVLRTASAFRSIGEPQTRATRDLQAEDSRGWRRRAGASTRATRHRIGCRRAQQMRAQHSSRSRLRRAMPSPVTTGTMPCATLNPSPRVRSIRSSADADFLGARATTGVQTALSNSATAANKRNSTTRRQHVSGIRTAQSAQLVDAIELRQF